MPHFNLRTQATNFSSFWLVAEQARANLNKVKEKSTAVVQYFNRSCTTEVVMHYLPEDMITLKAIMNFYYPEASTSW